MSAIQKFLNKNKQKIESKKGPKSRSFDDLDPSLKNNNSKKRKRTNSESNVRLLDRNFESNILTKPELFASTDSSKDLLPIIKNQLKHLYQEQQQAQCECFFFSCFVVEIFFGVIFYFIFMFCFVLFFLFFF